MKDRASGAMRTAVVFVALAFGFAWLFYLAVVLSRAHILPFSMESGDWFRASLPGSIVSEVFRDFGPALAGVLALAFCRGRAGLAELGGRLVRWRMPGWLWLAGLFPVVLNVAAALAGFAGGNLRFAPEPPAAPKLILIFFLMAALDGPLGEEIGWRGVLLPELLRRIGAHGAALLVGVVWYLWHIPLYIADGKLSGAKDHAIFAASCMLLSAIFTWFFLRSRGSVLLTIYLHNVSNYSVLLRHKLLETSGDSQLPALVLYGGLLILGIAAFAALWRKGRIDPASILAA